MALHTNSAHGMTESNITAEAFQNWVIANGKSQKTAKNYASTVKGPLSKWTMEAEITEDSLFEVGDNYSIQEIATKIRLLDIFIERNKKGNGMYNSALNWYGYYISELNNSDITTDIDEIYSQSTSGSTERETLVATRLGQGKFREDLITHWGQCAATGYKQQNMLIASHIKPWRDSTNKERLDNFNGFLFSPNIDKAFDKNFISFKSNGGILISSELEEPRRLGIDATMKVDLTPQHQEYLEYHRDILFRIQQETKFGTSLLFNHVAFFRLSRLIASNYPKANQASLLDCAKNHIYWPHPNQ